ncbi:methionyl-tRNA formyltransferase [Ichthyenterobacterium sp. W332]|uniref:Methionyl-tRNA formyltransferase n=1 Tax=Microcosmobacter mediterraneus TaxID=3075607 RepID=A0ABU2YMP0_9FLAO|nr:methionyl-tRNA formyltransferase [Ichthyenterobacterium sp. W332]MDT0559411.1 methionyl-tRNA formyltransferase [Ichthyenterobacterium sp. W332]
MIKDTLRIVFMGTPDFAVTTLKTILEHNYNVVGVITAPDKPAGRGRKLNESAVKKFALEQQLNIMQPTNLKDDNFIEELRSLNANLQVIVAFRMLPKIVWSMPKYGTFNLHASLLPEYRGAAPIHWAIINGETKTGVTTFFIDEKIDTGAIIDADEISIENSETVGSLHNKLMVLGSKLVITTIQQIENETVTTKIQPKKKNLKTAYKLNPKNCKIDWTENTLNIYNKIRGLNPFPSAWCFLRLNTKDLRVKIFDIDFCVIKHNETQGKVVIKDKSLQVYTKDGYIIIKEIQLPGKRKMEVKSLLNGFKFSEDAIML